MYSTDPSGLTAVIVPFVGLVTIVMLVRSRAPSTSMSFAATSVTTAKPCSVESASSWASGASLIGLMVTVTVAESHRTGRPGSQTV